MKTKLATFGVWLLLSAVALAEGSLPVAKVTGPKESPPGELVILDASQSQGLGYLWLLVNSEKSFLPVDNGLRCVFSTGTPGEYSFVLIVAGANANGGPAAAMVTHRLKVIGASPQPPDPPPPGPVPGKITGAILLYESEEMSQELGSIIQKLRTEKITRLKVLDKDATQSSDDQPVQQVQDVLKYLGSKKLPRIVAVDSSGGFAADTDVTSYEDVQRTLTAWGIKP